MFQSVALKLRHLILPCTGMADVNVSDVESATAPLFDNEVVHTLSWSDVSVTVKDRVTKQPLAILHDCHGIAKAGQVTALMGPSGSGKTTLLNVLAHRSQSPYEGTISLNGDRISKQQLRTTSSYVEQDDALLGSLTVEETITFASKLATPHLTRKTRQQVVSSLIASFGLEKQRHTIIGTPLRKGISGGQKRRVSVAAQMVTFPKVLFLDEPTSGLDSAASFMVMKFISQMAKQHKLIVIASIHQPSASTFELFDSLMLLSQAKTCYFGPVKALPMYLEEHMALPVGMNPAEFLLDLVNVDFRQTVTQPVAANASEKSLPEIDAIFGFWNKSQLRVSLQEQLATPCEATKIETPPRTWQYDTTFILLYRNWIKSYRDLLAYGTRILMYAGLAILMGTVWLRLPYDQASIQPFINALFFSGAFMSFMAVAYVPSIIEDLQTMNKEHANGLYGPLPFMLANFLVGLPWLALITLIFSVIAYWLSNFQASASGFWLWCLWLYLDLLAAEGLVLLLSSIFPVFVVALAATAFANGLWMSVGGFLVPLSSLNVFWKCESLPWSSAFPLAAAINDANVSLASDVFHYIDYQA